MNYKKFDPLKLTIKKEGLNYSLCKDELPLKISNDFFVFERYSFFQKDISISHTSEELLLHMISELDGEGGV